MRQIESRTTSMDRPCKRVLNRPDLTRTVLTVALPAIVLGLSLSTHFYNYVLVNGYIALALCGALVILLVVQPSWTNVASVALGSLVLAGLDYRVMGFQPRYMAAFSFPGLSSLAVMGMRTIWARNQERRLLLWACLPVIVLAAWDFMASISLYYIGVLHPKTFDLYLYSFDCSLHIQFNFLLGQIFKLHSWFRFASLLFYFALPLQLALVYAAHLRLKTRNALPVTLAFLVTGPLGVLFYNMVPATGPSYVFGQDFPWHPLSTAQAMHLVLETVRVRGARNAIPSLHMAWALLAWLNSKGLSRWMRVIALAFVIFNVFATLGTGEHYFVDLVVAFPFALMVQALCLYPLPFQCGVRREAFLFGTFASLAWMALVSFAIPFFWISPVIPWAIVAATISISSWLMHRLQNAEFANERVQPEIAVKAQAMVAAG
jgi:hypothetical protein